MRYHATRFCLTPARNLSIVVTSQCKLLQTVKSIVGTMMVKMVKDKTVGTMVHSNGHGSNHSSNKATDDGMVKGGLFEEATTKSWGTHGPLFCIADPLYVHVLRCACKYDRLA